MEGLAKSWQKKFWISRPPSIKTTVSSLLNVSGERGYYVTEDDRQLLSKRQRRLAG
jgi:hypothetical protein